MEFFGFTLFGSLSGGALIAVAAVNDNIEDIILAGLGQIPSTSRLC